MSSTRLRSQWVLCAALILLAVASRYLTAQNPQLPGPDHAGQYPQADIAYGSQVYAAQCATCHGATGDAVGGVNLRTGPLRRAATDQELTRLLSTGIPGAGMTPFKFTPAEQAGIVAYIRSMNSLEPGSVKLGDVARGRAIFDGKGACLTCHAVGARGSLVAPDLTDIGTSRAASAIERHLLTPSAQMMPINRPVRMVTSDGKVINGRRLNEDTYTVQLMDTQGQLVSLAKTDLREFQVSTTSTMPSYADKLSSQELSDLMAYLLSLKGS